MQKYWYLSYRIPHNKKYENINRVNPLYLIIGEVDGYIEENNGNKYLTFASADKKQKSDRKIYKVLG